MRDTPKTFYTKYLLEYLDYAISKFETFNTFYDKDTIIKYLKNIKNIDFEDKVELYKFDQFVLMIHAKISREFFFFDYGTYYKYKELNMNIY